ncbi:hypothetical protein [Ancylobacter rudongensis]|uniref:Uncharacterized protein n=1 Tax=Ancylobacter rudongensis TaxID=177413 RepID=A0A1G4USA8_9HYPH|nr:hypothetical protein [Ancylobacter rudongensis]SCW95679.1 hypothetical protein SAMN05660859_0088 [Ancylobacter rudongensis]
MSLGQSLVEINGILRYRTVLPGYNAKDPALDPRYVTFDSTWQNTLRLMASGTVAGSSLSTSIYQFRNSAIGGTVIANRIVRVIPVPGATVKTPALVWAVAPAGNVQKLTVVGNQVFQTPVPFQKGYRMCSVNLKNDAIHVSPSYNNRDYTYLVFKTDPTTTEESGGNGARIGLHPLYGMGAFFSRPGFNHLTCSLDDMMLTSARNMAQVYETGYVTVDATYSGEPFGNSGGGGTIVNLRGSYPDFPPVIAFRTSTGAISRLMSVFWLSPSQILVTGASSGNQVRFAVLSATPDYIPDPDTRAVRRVRMVNGSLDITKRNIDWSEATSDADFLFRSSRQTAQFNGMLPFPTVLNSGFYPLHTPSPAGAGPPFVFMLAFEATCGWWCGCGYVDTQDIVGITQQFNPRFRGAVISNTHYQWYRDSQYSNNINGWVTTMNISDF